MIISVKKTLLIFLLAIFCVQLTFSSSNYRKDPQDGTLLGDVQNWAALIQNYILQLANDGIRREYTQSLFDQANYTFQKKDGTEPVDAVKETLGDYFSRKKRAAQLIADKVVELYEEQVATNWSSMKAPQDIHALPMNVYRDSDIPSRFPDDLLFSPYFKQNVSMNSSIVKISDEVPRSDREVIRSVMFTHGLEKIFRKNAGDDPYLRWQYFGSSTGVIRMFPGREWDTNFAGFYNDYDPRTRPWYIAATSGPKDVVIILDCSLSMDGEKFTMAKAVAKTVINTLTKQDYLNVVSARASHWDEVGKWHYHATEVLSCKPDKMVPATVAHRKDLIEKIYSLKAGGTSELEKGFEMAFTLLQSKSRTGCQSMIIFVTDGKDTDGENVRCGPGYYTRSGYVPGPICKYNWTQVWDIVKTKQEHTEPKARIFSYLTKDEGEAFPGRLACNNRGYLEKLMNGENLISKMHQYFEFLAKSSKNSEGLWTSPYIDAWGLGLMVTHAVPAITKNGKTIGVAGIDATLDEIENFLTKHQWGSVTSFLLNNQGQTIFHPLLTQSTGLKDDPIFIPIHQLEQDKEGNPQEFSKVKDDMIKGIPGLKKIKNARRGIQKGDYRAGVKYINLPLEYYYASLNDSEYSFAFKLAATDKVFRRSQAPKNRNKTSYFNLLIEYNSTKGRKALPQEFENMEVLFNDIKYPSLRVTYLYSSIFLAPKCHCDPNKYFFDDDLAQKTIDAHRYINGIDPDIGCKAGGKYERGIIADVLITQPVEEVWRDRSFESIAQVKWTYVGMRSGVFRTYPGHRSRRTYDCTQRPWYLRTVANPTLTSISTPYMDAAGVGKIITISQAVFEGMLGRSNEWCAESSLTGPWAGGCKCNQDEECISHRCYVSAAPGPNKHKRRCATERVEAVTSLDILYDDFHDKTIDTMQSSDRQMKSCGRNYRCPSGEMGCVTRCYLFDNRANIIMDPGFKLASPLDTSKYKGVTLGKKEGEVMKELIYRHGFFIRTESIDFQGGCSISPSKPKVTLTGFPRNPEEQDNYYKDKGPIPKFNNEYGCIQDVVGYEANQTALGSSGMVTGNVSGPCMSGFYYVIALPKTNLYLLVIENWKNTGSDGFYNFNCKIARSIVNSGAYRIVNGTCAHQETSASSLAQQERCPVLRDIELDCDYNKSSQISPGIFIFVTLLCLFWLLPT
ncbi:voltage-dependent calcium channel subunit alpha-2/delta-2-like isoform X2 [Lineus longissimus]|uniref:voltage-dependent calcium channel subunit alpha-2/delta-2-like isoform X2 n=1 Tax=Lineus longissimus TaxID=88925 RepID=UPI002B4E12B7